METHSVINNLDYIVIGIVLISGLLAFMRGFMRELFSLIAWAGAYFAAVYFYGPAVPWVQHYIKTEKMAEWGAMAIVFVFVLIALVIIGHLICTQIKGRAMTWLDRSIGFLYGLTRGAVIVCLIYMSARMVIWPDIDASATEQAEDKDGNPPPELLLQAKTRPLMASGADMLLKLVPGEDQADDADEIKDEAEKAGEQALEKIKSVGSASDEKASPVNVRKLFSPGE